MIQLMDIRVAQNARAVVKLQKESYRVEADLMGVASLPPLLDTVETIQSCNEQFIGFFEGEKLGGILSYKTHDHVVDIHRVAVSPSFFRRGIARSLLAFLEEYVRSAKEFIVQTGALNQPAIELYINCGYTPIEKEEVEPGLWMQKFHKQK